MLLEFLSSNSVCSILPLRRQGLGAGEHNNCLLLNAHQPWWSSAGAVESTTQTFKASSHGLISKPLRRTSTSGGLHNSTSTPLIIWWSRPGRGGQLWTGRRRRNEAPSRPHTSSKCSGFVLFCFFLVEDCFEFNKNVTF